MAFNFGGLLTNPLWNLGSGLLAAGGPQPFPTGIGQGLVTGTQLGHEGLRLSMAQQELAQRSEIERQRLSLLRQQQEAETAAIAQQEAAIASLPPEWQNYVRIYPQALQQLLKPQTEGGNMFGGGVEGLSAEHYIEDQVSRLPPEQQDAARQYLMAQMSREFLTQPKTQWIPNPYEQGGGHLEIMPGMQLPSLGGIMPSAPAASPDMVATSPLPPQAPVPSVDLPPGEITDESMGVSLGDVLGEGPVPAPPAIGDASAAGGVPRTGPEGLPQPGDYLTRQEKIDRGLDPDKAFQQTTQGVEKVDEPAVSEQAKRERAQMALSLIDQLERLALAPPAQGVEQGIFVGLKPGVGNRLGNALGFGQARLSQEDPRISTYIGFSEGTVAPLIRTLGEAGALSDRDVARALSLIPIAGPIPDTEEVARRKISELRILIGNALHVHGAAGSTNATDEPVMDYYQAQ